MDFYNVVKLDELITPKDLLLDLSELVAKVKSLEFHQAPPMLVSMMYDLVLEIALTREKALAVTNLENPEPMTIPLITFSTNSLTQKERIAERIKILAVLGKSGWRVKLTTSDNLIKLSVAKYELVPI